MMKVITRLTWANLTNRPMSSILTVATLLVAVSLISMLLQFSAFVEERLAKDTAGVDLVVGAKGSPLQLVLSALFHVDVPTGNITLRDAQAIMRDPQIRSATPLALGDSFRGYRIVGTSHDFIDLYNANLAEGALWEHPQQVVIGARLQRELGMNMGQQFVTAHGIASSTANVAEHDHAPYEVVGVLEPTGSVLDRLILTSVDSVWLAHEAPHEEDAHEEGDHAGEHDGHDDEHEGHEEEHDDHADEHDDHADDHDAHEAEREEHEEGHAEGHDHHDEELVDLRTTDPTGREVTALLVRYSSPIAAVRLPRLINSLQGMQAAVPAVEVTRLFNLSEGLESGMRVLGLLFILIGGVSIFVTVSNATAHKTYDIALLRAMGAKPSFVFLQQLMEGAIIALISAVAGIAFAHLILFIASNLFEPLQSVGLNGSLFPSEELYLFLGTVLVGVIAVIWPAARSYKLDPVILLQRGR